MLSSSCASVLRAKHDLGAPDFGIQILDILLNIL